MIKILCCHLLMFNISAFNVHSSIFVWCMQSFKEEVKLFEFSNKITASYLG